MKKGPEIPQGLVWGILVLVVIGVAVGMYFTLSKPTPQVDPKTLSPSRLEDPDPRSGG